MLIAQGVWAFPEECLQDIQRSAPCENLIYKTSNVAVPRLNVSPGDIICICKSDVQQFMSTPKNKVAEITQRSQLRRMAADYGMDEDNLLKLIKSH